MTKCNTLRQKEAVIIKNNTDLAALSHLLSNEIDELEKKIANAPEGKLVARKNQKGEYRYTKKIYLPNGKIKEIYLGTKSSLEAKSLAEKADAETRLPILKQKKRLIDKLILLDSIEPAESILRKARPGLVPLLDSDTLPDNNSLLEWKNAPYNRCQSHPEQLKYTTVIPGLIVRSKAEADIISRLDHYGVPYHYDELYNFNNTWCSRFQGFGRFD